MERQLDDIIKSLPVSEVRGESRRTVSRVVNANSSAFRADDICWVSDKNKDLLRGIEQGSVIISPNVEQALLNEQCTYLVVDNPRHYFLTLVKTFFLDPPEQPEISTASIIHPSVRLGANVTIKAGVILEKECEVGDNTVIDYNTVVKKGTRIGRRVKIGCNNTIGGDGFGYEKGTSDQFEFLPHIGNVVIEDDVEIGNNTTIDRAVVGSTILRRNVKVDNLVHIAHGVDIGENSLVIANAMIAGSCVIGKNVWVAPSASILNKLTVGDDAVVGMGAVVLKNVADKQVVVGNPARDLKTIKK